MGNYIDYCVWASFECKVVRSGIVLNISPGQGWWPIAMCDLEFSGRVYVKREYFDLPLGRIMLFTQNMLDDCPATLITASGDTFIAYDGKHIKIYYNHKAAPIVCETTYFTRRSLAAALTEYARIRRPLPLYDQTCDRAKNQN
jgi:hypothetical protein